MVEPEYIVDTLREALGEGTQVEVTDMTGTKNHYKALIISEAFEGKLLIARHRLVYAALEQEMKGPIHALTLDTLTPEEWRKRGA